MLLFPRYFKFNVWVEESLSQQRHIILPKSKIKCQGGGGGAFFPNGGIKLPRNIYLKISYNINNNSITKSIRIIAK